MKVIDLLNKIANGEEVPKHIKFNDLNLYWNGENYAYDIIEESFKAPFYLFHNDELNDEIEIIEEPKKIEKIKWCAKESLALVFTDREKIDTIARRTEKIKNSLNKIIEEINGRDTSNK